MNSPASSSAYEAAFPRLGAVRGLRIVAPGCGEGRMVRLMAAEGAHVVGLESNPSRLADARSAAPAADETYLEGEGDALPFADASADRVVYFGTLHHVPVAGQAKAVAEAARVLKPGGVFYVSEPLAEGPYFTLLKPVDDETHVRAEALKALGGAAAHGLVADDAFVFTRVMRFADFAAFRKMVLTIGPERADDFARAEPEMRSVFERTGVRDGDAVTFAQPFRVNILRKRRA
jgi:SAM-dependent methyltransferase